MIIRNAVLFAAESIAKEKKGLFGKVLKGDFYKGLKTDAETWESMISDIENSAADLMINDLVNGLGTQSLANAIFAATLPEPDTQLWSILNEQWDGELRSWEQVRAQGSDGEVGSMLRTTAFGLYLKAFGDESANAFAKIAEEEQLVLIEWLHVVRKKVAAQVARTMI